jgi:hypothetical protein
LLLRAAGPVKGGNSRFTSRGDGGMMGVFIATNARLSCVTSVGEGEMTVAGRPVMGVRRSADTSEGGGATILAARVEMECDR